MSLLKPTQKGMELNILDLDPIRQRAEYSGIFLVKEDVFALLDEVERLRIYLNGEVRIASELADTVTRLVSERDAARDSLGKVVMMWDEQISQGFPFLSNSDLVPALREILAGYDYDHEI